MKGNLHRLVDTAVVAIWKLSRNGEGSPMGFEFKDAADELLGITRRSLHIVTCAVTLLTVQAQAEEGWGGLAGGDIIVQDRPGPRSDLLKRSGGTSFTHIGLVRPTGGGFFVADVTPQQGMSEEHIGDFIEKGRGGRYWVFRYDGLSHPSTENHPAVTSAYATHYLADYDPFMVPGAEALYDAEFINVVYGENGVELGKPTTLKALGTRSEDDLMTLFGRWQDHPVCQAARLNSRDCRAKLMDFAILTPASIAGDRKLEMVYTNAK